MKSSIHRIIANHQSIITQIAASDNLIHTIEAVTQLCVQAVKEDKKILFCGNGGSAADAQHLAAELSGSFYLDRDPIHAEALHVNTSHLTAVANDYDFGEVYARLVKAKGQPGDILFALSTSGNSSNIVRAVEEAENQTMQIVAMTGMSGGLLKDRSHYLLNCPSDDTPRIQEAHILIGHIICEQVEHLLFGI